MHSVHFAFCMHYPLVHDTSSKNAKLSSAKTSFLWRHTNTSKNHGYKAVADDSRRQPFRAEDSAPAPDEEGKKGRKGKTFSDHAYPTVSSRPRGRCVQNLFQIGSDMWICIRYKKNKQTFSLIYKIYVVGDNVMYWRLLVKCPMFLSNFNKIWGGFDRFYYKFPISNFHVYLSSGSNVDTRRQTDRQTATWK
jgi:hypothetical protein